MVGDAAEKLKSIDRANIEPADLSDLIKCEEDLVSTRSRLNKVADSLRQATEQANYERAIRLSRAAAGEQNWQESISFAQEALSIVSDDADAKLLIVDAQEAQNRLLLEATRKKLVASLKLVRGMLDRGRVGDAVKELNSAIGLTANSADLASLVSSFRRSVESLAVGMGTFQQAIEMLAPSGEDALTVAAIKPKQHVGELFVFRCSVTEKLGDTIYLVTGSDGKMQCVVDVSAPQFAGVNYPEGCGLIIISKLSALVTASKEGDRRKDVLKLAALRIETTPR